jgi:hypothetical protein
MGKKGVKGHMSGLLAFLTLTGWKKTTITAQLNVF